jgi:hypothetical protein
MASPNTIDALNQLLRLHSRSLPSYLLSAQPFRTQTESRTADVLRQIAEDHQLMATKIGTEVLREGGTPDVGEYPMDFTFMHDLSIDYLIREVTRRLEVDIETIGQFVRQLQHAPAARAIAEEALGAAEGQLENILDLRSSAMSATT